MERQALVEPTQIDEERVGYQIPTSQRIIPRSSREQDFFPTAEAVCVVDEEATIRNKLVPGHSFQSRPYHRGCLIEMGYRELLCISLDGLALLGA